MRWVFVASLAGLGACAPYPPAPPAQPPEPISSVENQCRALEHQYLVGRNRTEIPAQPANASWRVTCTTCPVTMDYNPSRLNIFYDERTGIVRDVRCG